MPKKAPPPELRPEPRAAESRGRPTPTKAPPAAVFESAIRWFCCICAEANRLNRYACNGCGAGRWKHDHQVKKATHWACPSCREEVSIRRNQCSSCSGWRTRAAELIHNGQPMEIITDHPSGPDYPLTNEASGSNPPPAQEDAADSAGPISEDGRTAPGRGGGRSSSTRIR